MDPFDAMFRDEGIFLNTDRNLVAAPLGCRREDNKFKGDQAVGPDFIRGAHRKDLKQTTAHIVAEITGRVHEEAYGTLYGILRQMDYKGYIKKIKGEPSPKKGGRSKTYFKLTPAGIQALKDAIANPVDSLRYE